MSCENRLAEFGTSFRGKRLVLLEPWGTNGHDLKRVVILIKIVKNREKIEKNL